MIVGILGGGQLGRMLALAGARLGITCRCYDEAPDACAGQVAPLFVGGWDQFDRLDAFAAGVDVVTYEFENVPVAAAEHLARRVPVYPPPGALRVCQDRLEEKTLFRRLGAETPAFAAIDTLADLHVALEKIGLPAVLKTRRQGYDGKGQAVLRQASDAEHAWSRLTTGRPPHPPGQSADLILEAFVPFERELSIIAVAGRDGSRVFYPLTENRHEGGILRVSRAPAPGTEGGNSSLQRAAESLAGKALASLNYTGVLAIELFELRGHLLCNEMAPRVHNSGHWTIDGSATSQFENHLRAVAGLPLGSAAMIAENACAGMVNLIGTAPRLERLCAVRGTSVHMYGKSPREGRKIGHVNAVAGSPALLGARLAEVQGLRTNAAEPQPRSESISTR